MSELILHRSAGSASELAMPLPRPRNGDGHEVTIRAATLDDLPFIDALQKQHNKMVGFFPRKWFEDNIKTEKVLIAEEVGTPALRAGSHGSESRGTAPVGYCIYNDRYLKREELGIVYHLNVAPGKQRGLIGAALVKAAFERCPYGVRMFCCWCAQDIEANYFWESIGFVPIAFRTGSRPRMRKDGTVSKPERIHIFWQRRIREGDTETPYWFPSETTGGALRENRIVLPIPPGTHWSDAKPAVLPGWTEEHQKALEAASERSESTPRARQKRAAKPQPKPAPPAEVHSSGMWFAPPEPPGPPEPTAEELKAQKAKERAERNRNRPKNDPKLVAAARELRDRYTEQINAPGNGLLLPPSAYGKYDVSRQLESAPTWGGQLKQTPAPHLLKAA